MSPNGGSNHSHDSSSSSSSCSSTSSRAWSTGASSPPKEAMPSWPFATKISESDLAETNDAVASKVLVLPLGFEGGVDTLASHSGISASAKASMQAKDFSNNFSDCTLRLRIENESQTTGVLIKSLLELLSLSGFASIGRQFSAKSAVLGDSLQLVSSPLLRSDLSGSVACLPAGISIVSFKRTCSSEREFPFEKESLLRRGVLIMSLIKPFSLFGFVSLTKSAAFGDDLKLVSFPLEWRKSVSRISRGNSTFFFFKSYSTERWSLFERDLLP